MGKTDDKHTDATLQLLTEAARAAGIEPPRVVLPEDRHVELNSIEFHYLDWGNETAPHVLLLHGGALQAHTWDLAALLLRDRYHLVALSQRGHGDTGWTPEKELDKDASDLMLEDTRQFIEHLGYDRLALVGMSMGGINAIRYAARYPDKLTALGIVDVAPESMREGQIEMETYRKSTETLDAFDDFLARSQEFMPHRPVEHLRYSLTHALRQTEDGRWTWKQDHRPRRPVSDEERQIRSEALWANLKSIRTPTMLFRGADSRILDPAVADRVVNMMADCRMVEIPGATHNVHSDNPGDFARALDEFLASTAGAAAER